MVIQENGGLGVGECGELVENGGKWEKMGSLGLFSALGCTGLGSFLLGHEYCSVGMLSGQYIRIVPSRRGTSRQAHKFRQSYLKSTVPSPFGKGAASTSSNHQARSRARGLPLFDAP